MTTDRLRALALDLPGVLERETWGRPTFRVREKLFLTLDEEAGTATVKARPGEQAALLTAEPRTFAVAPYVGRHGWVLVRLARVVPEHLRELVVEAWRRTAPARLVATFDERAHAAAAHAMGAGHDAATVSPIDAMAAEAIALFTAAVARTPPESWELPSIMEGWSVRELVGHATGSAAKIVTLVEGGRVWGRSEPADWASEDPRARLDALATRLRHALPGADLDAPRPSPEGEAPLRRALAYPVSDLALHSWDLHRSQGRLVELPDGLLAFCRELVGSIPEEMLRRPGGFGPAKPAPDGATPTARLLAHLGRSV